MLKFFKRVWMGAGYLEGYGEHPGTMILIVSTFAAGAAGLNRGGLTGFVGGTIFGFVCMVPFYIIGCVERAKGYERDVERTAALLKKEY